MDLNLDLNLIMCRPWLWIWDMLDIWCKVYGVWNCRDLLLLNTKCFSTRLASTQLCGSKIKCKNFVMQTMRERCVCRGGEGEEL